MPPPGYYPVMPDFPKPKIVTYRAALPPTQVQFVGGDPGGLYQLAGSLYSYVDKVNPVFDRLVQVVVGLVKKDHEFGGYTAGPGGGMVGVAAHTFESYFIADASMMNGLDCVICQVAQALDTFASGLANKEHLLETQLEELFASSSPGKPDLAWFDSVRANGKQRLYISNHGIQTAKSLGWTDSKLGILIRQVGEISVPLLDQAEKDRSTFATAIASISQVLIEGLDYYKSHSDLSSTDPNAIISSPQFSPLDPNLNGRASTLKSLIGGLHPKSSDLAAAERALRQMGLDAGMAKSLLGDVKDAAAEESRLKSLASGGSKFLGFASDAIPLLMLIGGFVA